MFSFRSIVLRFSVQSSTETINCCSRKIYFLSCTVILMHFNIKLCIIIDDYMYTVGTCNCDKNISWALNYANNCISFFYFSVIRAFVYLHSFYYMLYIIFINKHSHINPGLCVIRRRVYIELGGLR